MQKLLFLVLSLFSGIVEYGFLWMGLTQGLGVAHAVLCGLSYQAGNLLFINEGDYLKRGLIAIIVASIGFGMYFSHLVPANYGVVLLFMAIAMLSVSIQTARSFMKASVNTTLKRGARIVGFVMSVLLVVPMIREMTIVIITMLTMYVLLKQKVLMKG